MIGTTLVPEAPATGRPGPGRAASPPVLIEIPTLRGRRPPTRRAASSRKTPGGMRRRRLRREFRVALGITAVLGGLVAPAGLVLEGRRPADPATLPDPLTIELQLPIPEPAGPTDHHPWAEGPPVAFPGYLLPGDGDEEHADARP